MRKLRYLAIILSVALAVSVPFTRQPFLAGESPVVFNKDTKKGGKKR